MDCFLRSEKENERQRCFVRRAAPSVDTKKLAVYSDGLIAYPLTALTPKERKAMRSAGYVYRGNHWYRETGPKLRVVK